VWFARGAPRTLRAVDLNEKAQFDTCAVVGSSGALLKKQYGAEIDAHSAVIRCHPKPKIQNPTPEIPHPQTPKA
jgi:hypothetical protein